MLNVNFTLSSWIHVVVPINFIELFFNKVGKKKEKRENQSLVFDEWYVVHKFITI